MKYVRVYVHMYSYVHVCVCVCVCCVLCKYVDGWDYGEHDYLGDNYPALGNSPLLVVCSRKEIGTFFLCLL